MGTRWEEKDVLCPFFVESGTRSIRCEGVFPDSWITQTFSGAGARRARMEAACMGPYRTCGLYRKIEEKYEE